MSEKTKTQSGTIAQKLKEAFNKESAEFKCEFSVPVGCEDLAYAGIPSKMEIKVSLGINRKNKKNILEINLARDDISEKTAKFAVTCDLNNAHDQLKVSVYCNNKLNNKPKDVYIQFSGDETAVSACRVGKNASGYKDIVQYLKDKISNYWFAGDHKMTPDNNEFVNLVKILWTNCLEKNWKTEPQDISGKEENDLLNFVCALVFVVVFRQMITDALCTTNPQNSDEGGGSVKEVAELVWDKIEYLRNIIGNSSDYRQKISEIYLEPKDVVTELSKQGLQFSAAVIDQVCSVLSSGGHLILTGLPGCGKTCLAEALSKAAKVESVVATANPCWSTDELIGRYLPTIAQGKENERVLEFKDGFFLNAIAKDGWLIIDELNRAPIDSCFGELFTVLSGKQVDLPFRTSEDKTISIVPEDSGNIAGQNLDHADDVSECRYVLRKNFRIICTMNDVDSVSLNALSFALQRRFYIVHVDMPSSVDRQGVFGNSLETVVQSYEKFFFEKSEYDKLCNCKKKVLDIINTLFANDNGDDFISKGIVGMAQPKEIMRTSISRMIEKSDNGFNLHKFGNPDERDMFLVSGIAMGVVMKVYPQLINRPETVDLSNVVELMKSTFEDEGEILLRPTDSGSKNGPTIIEYLRNEFLRFFLHSPEMKDLWPETTKGKE